MFSKTFATSFILVVFALNVIFKYKRIIHYIWAPETLCIFGCMFVYFLVFLQIVLASLPLCLFTSLFPCRFVFFPLFYGQFVLVITSVQNRLIKAPFNHFNILPIKNTSACTFNSIDVRNHSVG